MRRGSNNRETPKGVPSSKNNRQLVTCRPFRDSCMRTKPNSYRHAWVEFTGRVAKPFSMHTGPGRLQFPILLLLFVLLLIVLFVSSSSSSSCWVLLFFLCVFFFFFFFSFFLFFFVFFVFFFPLRKSLSSCHSAFHELTWSSHTMFECTHRSCFLFLPISCHNWPFCWLVTSLFKLL